MLEWFAPTLSLIIVVAGAWGAYQTHFERQRSEKRMEDWRREVAEKRAARIAALEAQSTAVKEQTEVLNGSHEDRDKLAQMINRL